MKYVIGIDSDNTLQSCPSNFDVWKVQGEGSVYEAIAPVEGRTFAEAKALYREEIKAHIRFLRRELRELSRMRVADVEEYDELNYTEAN
jgi:hypothetical protein